MPQISLKSLMTNSSPTYAAEVAQPFRDELTGINFNEMLTPEAVDAALNKHDDKVVLVVLNSVCGCAARGARPGAIFSLLNDVVPDEYFTVFAGMEKEAVDHFRTKYLQGLTPSSPNIALFKNGELIHIHQRYEIEGKGPGHIAEELASVYDKVCNKTYSEENLTNLKNYLVNRYHVSMESLNE
ncbi:MAG: BrxA/BrxB family bacilliredoxin [Chitinophagales bacterium]